MFVSIITSLPYDTTTPVARMAHTHINDFTVTPKEIITVVTQEHAHPYYFVTQSSMYLRMYFRLNVISSTVYHFRVAKWRTCVLMSINLNGIPSLGPGDVT